MGKRFLKITTLRLHMTIKAGGGADRDRTGDLRRAKPALSQSELQPLKLAPRFPPDVQPKLSGLLSGGPKWT